VDRPVWIGNRACDGGAYNNIECGWDGGDCEEFNAKYLNCTEEYPCYKIGNRRCYGGAYNTTECGFDGGGFRGRLR